MDLNIIQSSGKVERGNKKITESKNKNFSCIKKENFLGTITDGDIRRALLNDIKLTSKAENIANKNLFVLERSKYSNKLQKIFLRKNRFITYCWTKK